MAALIISNSATFGALTNSTVGRLIALSTAVTRLKEALTTASADYTGVDGTEFESSPTTLGTPNNFGVSPDPENPGKNGQSYAYAVGRLEEEWRNFWAVARPFVEALDNGTASY